MGHRQRRSQDDMHHDEHTPDMPDEGDKFYTIHKRCDNRKGKREKTNQEVVRK